MSKQKKKKKRRRRKNRAEGYILFIEAHPKAHLAFQERNRNTLEMTVAHWRQFRLFHLMTLLFHDETDIVCMFHLNLKYLKC